MTPSCKYPALDADQVARVKGKTNKEIERRDADLKFKDHRIGEIVEALKKRSLPAVKRPGTSSDEDEGRQQDFLRTGLGFDVSEGQLGATTRDV